MKFKYTNRSTFSTILPLGILFLVLFVYSLWPIIGEKLNFQQNSGKEILTNCSDNADEKQKGVHFFAYVDTAENFQLLHRNNLEWVTWVSWGFQDDYNSPVVTHHNGDSVNIVKSNAGWLEQIGLIRAAGFKVFVKPHVWVNSPAEGRWRSDIFPSNEENCIVQTEVIRLKCLQIWMKQIDGLLKPKPNTIKIKFF